MSLIDDLDLRGIDVDVYVDPCDVEKTYALWFDAVENGLPAVLQLAQDPDCGEPAQIVEDAQRAAREIADRDRQQKILACCDVLLDQLDHMGPLDRARVLNEAAELTAEAVFNPPAVRIPAV